MSNAYIRVVNGQPFEHPIIEENLRAFYPNLDPNNPPRGFEKFIRQPYPTVGIYETFVGTTYQRVNGVIQDVHEVRPLTEEEKAAKIQFMKDTFPFSSWTFDDENGSWISPVPYPEDGNTYQWNETTLSWDLVSS